MDQHNLYDYPYTQRQRSPGPAPNARPGGAYQNSSAFSASANPDEDWTKISDLAERRRIQNRIAQRNYRKKLKRRLEELEKGTSSASPEQISHELSRPTQNSMSIALRQQNQRRSSQSTVASSDSQYSPEFPSTEEYWSDPRQSSAQPYPFSYPGTTAASFASIAPPVEYFPNDYSSTEYSQPTQVYGSSATCQPGYMQATSPPLPNLLGCVDAHSEPQYGNTSMLNAFDVNYASLAGVGIPATQPLGFSARTPPLTDSTSQLSSSRECSPPYFRALTPDSRSMSPNVQLFSC